MIIQATFLPGYPELTKTWMGSALAAEPIIFEGQLLKKGTVILQLPSTSVVVAQPYLDGEFIMPVGYATIWEIGQVEADTLVLHAEPDAESSGYAHDIYVDGKRVGTIYESNFGSSPNAILDYNFPLSSVSTFLSAAIVGGIALVGLLLAKKR